MFKGSRPPTILSKLFNDENNEAKKNRPKYFYIVVVIIIGVTTMIVSNSFSNGMAVESSQRVAESVDQAEDDEETFSRKKVSNDDLITAYEKAYEDRLKETLENIVGVNNVTVFVNIDATNKQVLERNTVSKVQTTTETDREGGKRQIEDESRENEVLIVKNGDEEVPIILETKKPHIRGVLVVASGAENINVKKWLVEAVTRVLDVPSHRVAVMPKKTKGD